MTRHPLQRCNHYIPGIRAMPWWDAREIPDALKLEADFEQIQEEFLDILLAGRLKLHPQSLGGPRKAITDGNWNIFELWSRGARNERNAVETPRTCRILASVPELVTHPGGLAYFSVLQPGVHVAAHCGPTNTRIRIHLGLCVPPGAEMRVGEETRTWREGKALIFDDSFEHEVFNHSDRLRAVLLLDAWHPDLTLEQRAELLQDRRDPEDPRRQEREGWLASFEALDADALMQKPLPIDRTMITALGADRLSSLRATAVRMARGLDRQLARAARHVLDAMGYEDSWLLAEETEPPEAAQGLLPAFVPELVDSLRSDTGFDANVEQIINALHITSIYWRSYPRNLQHMHDFITTWPAADRVCLVEKLADIKTFPEVMRHVAEQKADTQGLPFGALVPLLVAVGRAIDSI